MFGSLGLVGNERLAKCPFTLVKFKTLFFSIFRYNIVMAERNPGRGTPKGELIGLARAIKSTVKESFTFDGGGVPPDQWENHIAKQEEDERRKRDNDFSSHAEAWFAYFPHSREEWQGIDNCLRRMDKVYGLATILGQLSEEQQKYFAESLAIEEMIIEEIERRNWLGKLIPPLPEGHLVPSYLKGTVVDPDYLHNIVPPHQRLYRLRKQMWEDDELPGEDI
jgi:hypothetical protein